MSYINGIATGCFTGMLSSDGESSCVIRSTNDSFSSPPSLTGVCVMLQVCFNHDVFCCINSVI